MNTRPIRDLFPLTFVFALLWIFMSLTSLKIPQNGFFFLEQNLRFNQLIQKKEGELLKGEIVSGEISANYDQLGIIGIRFITSNRINNDQLEFRLKEKDSSNWYYRAKYNTDQFQPNQIFPFGFPPITSSAGKEYYFEIESLSGSHKNAVIVSPENPVVKATFTFSKRSIFENRKTTLSFLLIKFSNLFLDADFTLRGIVYALPLILFLLYRAFNLSGQLAYLIIITGSLVDTFLIRGKYYFIWLPLVVYWILSSLRSKISYKLSAVVAIVYLISVPLLKISLFPYQSEKIANWAFLFFIITLVIQEIQDRHPDAQANA